MLTNVTIQQNLSPEQLAESLYNATPEEFASFWFNFGKLSDCNGGEKKLHEFAKVMIPLQGGKRKEVFYKLYKFMQFYEVEKDI